MPTLPTENSLIIQLHSYLSRPAPGQAATRQQLDELMQLGAAIEVPTAEFLLCASKDEVALAISDLRLGRWVAVVAHGKTTVGAWKTA